jgi:hypothetical protein
MIAHRRRLSDDPEEYARKLSEQREHNHIPEDVPVSSWSSSWTMRS